MSAIRLSDPAQCPGTSATSDALSPSCSLLPLVRASSRDGRHFCSPESLVNEATSRLPLSAFMSAVPSREVSLTVPATCGRTNGSPGSRVLDFHATLSSSDLRRSTLVFSCHASVRCCLPQVRTRSGHTKVERSSHSLACVSPSYRTLQAPNVYRSSQPPPEGG